MQLPVNREAFHNEGASAILDIAGVPATAPEVFSRARKLFERLSFEAQVAILVEAYRTTATFDPTTGQQVCFCCGKPFWSTHGRQFVN